MAYTAWSVVYGEQPTAAKWNQLGTNDAGFKDGTNIDNLAITGAKIADGAITNAKLSTAADELGAAWKAWTPTISNSAGSISATINWAKYMRIGKTIIWNASISISSVSANGDLGVTAPVASRVSGQFAGAGREDVLVGNMSQVIFKSSTTVMSVIFYNNSGSSATAGYAHYIGGTYESA